MQSLSVGIRLLGGTDAVETPRSLRKNSRSHSDLIHS